MLTHVSMRGCGLTSCVVCINEQICDIREINVTIRSEILTTNICSLGFRDIREHVTLWILILQSLGCICELSVPLINERGKPTTTFLLFNYCASLLGVMYCYNMLLRVSFFTQIT
jgi:hypothetical protein